MAERKQKIMHLKGLKQAVKKLARGSYHCVEHKITEYHTKEVVSHWRAYIDGPSWTRRHSTPEAALVDLEALLRTSE